MILGKWIIQTYFSLLGNKVIERLRKIRIKEQGFGDKDVYPVKPALFY